MLKMRRKDERGYFHRGWLESYHSFSFAEYYDPKYMNWGPLRVINEDKVQPQTGFGTHGHRNMEIITYMLSGELSHKDDTGGGSSIVPGQIQRMSAGSGIRHSEMNQHPDQVAHLLQIWIEPNEQEVAPGYQDHNLDMESITGKLGLIVTGDEKEAEEKGIARIHQNAKVYAGRLSSQTVEQTLDPSRKAYLQLAQGELAVNGVVLQAGDALMIEQESKLALKAEKFAELLLFDLPA